MLVAIPNLREEGKVSVKQCPGANEQAESRGLDGDVEPRVANPRNHDASEIPPFFVPVGDAGFVQQPWREFRQPILRRREFEARIEDVLCQGACRPRLLESPGSEMDQISAISVEDLALEVNRRTRRTRMNLAKNQPGRVLVQLTSPPVGQPASDSSQSQQQRLDSHEVQKDLTGRVFDKQTFSEDSASDQCDDGCQNGGDDERDYSRHWFWRGSSIRFVAARAPAAQLAPKFRF